MAVEISDLTVQIFSKCHLFCFSSLVAFCLLIANIIKTIADEANQNQKYYNAENHTCSPRV